MNTIVSKFGGTSVADAGQIRKVADIIKANPDRRVVVVSAPGKRRKEDEKITDILISCHTMAKDGEDVTERFQLIRERYQQIATDLGIGGDIDTVIDQVEADIKNGADRSAVVSRGEFLSAHLIARFLGFTFLDAAEIIRFSDESTVDFATTNRLVQDRIADGRSFVIPGFYGAHRDGRVQIFSRGGSDISASLVAAGLNAKVYENWTDVSGLLSADPRIVDAPAPIKEVTYRQLRELAFLGANVFHDEAVAPVADKTIPINIRNTNDPDHPGTMIVGTVEGEVPTVTGVAGKTGFRGIFIDKPFVAKEVGFLKAVQHELEALGVKVAHVAAGSDSVFVVVNAESLEPVEQDVDRTLVQSLNCKGVDMQRHIALVGVVGPEVGDKPELLSRLFSSLNEDGIAVRFVSAGYSASSVVVGVDEDRYADAVRSLYRGSRV